jgi:hypothetical protein
MSTKVPAQFRVKKEWQHLLEKDVIICIPTRGNDIYWGLTAFLIQQYHIWPKIRLLFCRCGWQAPTMKLLEHLEDRDYDYVFFVDADISPCWDVILQLMARDKPIITAPVYMFDPVTYDIHFNVHRDKSMPRVHAKGTGVERIHSTSFSSLLIRRDVLERFKETGESYSQWSPIVPEIAKLSPPDIQFFSKCSHFGFEVYVDWDFKTCVHHKYVALCEDSIDMFTLKKGQEIEELVAHEHRP